MTTSNNNNNNSLNNSIHNSIHNNHNNSINNSIHNSTNGLASATTSQNDKTTSSSAPVPPSAPWANYLPRSFVKSTFEQSANAVRLLADAARSPHAYFPPAIR